MSLGPLIVVSGPAGSGKSTLIERAVREFGPRLRHSVSATTRAPRRGEVDGVHYHFWTRERFERAVAAGEFLEYAIVFGSHYYGTPRTEVEPYRKQGIAVVVDVDVQGASQLRQKCPDAYTIFLDAPPGEFERRLRARGTESEEAIQRRLAEARVELSRAHESQRIIVNDDMERTAAELCDVIRSQFETAS